MAVRRLGRHSMSFKLLVSFMGFVHFVNSAQTGNSKWHNNDTFNDVMPTSGYKPDIKNVRSKLECGQLCGQQCENLSGQECGQCRSFFYDKENEVCQLHNSVLSTHVGLIEKPSSRYYIRTVPTLTCPADDTVYRTVELSDNTFFTYKVVRTPTATQAVASSYCIADGGHLVRLTSDSKMEALFYITMTCTGYKGSFFVDLNNTNAVDPSDVNQWVSSVGTPLPTGNTFWEATQPNFPSIDHCAVLDSRTTAATTTTDVSKRNLCDRRCTISLSYICEKD